MPTDKLFFIAILPPEEVQAEITVFKEDMRDNYGSKTALKVMPHITLKAPFKLPAQEREQLFKWFAAMPTGATPFKITLENFGSFDNKHNKVIFVQPVVTEAMATLQTNIISNFKQAYPHINMSTYEHQFKPHITIAYRDLTEDNYARAWQAYKEQQYRATFTCDSFCLLQHNGQHWEVVQEHHLQ